MKPRCVPWVVLVLVAGCSLEPEHSEDAEALTLDQKRGVSDRIKAVSATRGVTNPVLFGGIPNTETGLVQCWKDATYHCQGPYSSYCGGPVLAGSGDGPCSIQQGGLGMYQFDAGTHAQTLASYGSHILELDGNVQQGVQTIIDKIEYCPNTPSFSGDAAVIAWLNGAVPGTAAYETFLTAMAWCYNGCSPGGCGAHAAVRNKYRQGVQDLINGLGWDYWYGGGGGSIEDPIVAWGPVARNADGRLELFTRADDQTLWHVWQMGDGTWSGWANLGGQASSDPVAGANADGRLEVFARGLDDAIWHRWQLASGWSEWVSLGGAFAGTPVVGHNADGRLEVFARGTDGAIWFAWQTSPSGAWSGWTTLGGWFPGDPAVGRNADGRLEVFARGGDGALWHAWQLGNGGWSSWVSEGGDIVGRPAVAANADGRMEVFARGSDGAIWFKWQHEPNGAWSGWATLGGWFPDDPAVGRNSDGRLEVYARGGDGALWHIWQLGDGGWSSWVSEGGDIVGRPAVAANADGRQEVFARGIDGGMWFKWQLQPSGAWSGWNGL